MGMEEQREEFSKIRLFFTGIAMGVADVIPGISGGTVAFLSGIYEKWLLSIQSLQLQSFRKIAWPFLVPLGAGIACGFLALAHVMNLLLSHDVYRIYLYALFFGLVLASAWQCGKKAEIKTPSRWIACGCGLLIAYMISGDRCQIESLLSPIGLVLAGSLASGAMLLPGISGSYLLCLLGIYPVAMAALANPIEGWSILLPLAIGIAVGLMVFSRLIHALLKHFHFFTLSLLTGFMLGGLRSIWPFGMGNPFFIGMVIVFGVAVVFFLSKLKRSTVPRI